MNLKIGDRVKYIDDVGGGEIIEIHKSELTIEDEHGFHVKVTVNQVISEVPGGYSPTFKKESMPLIEQTSVQENEDLRAYHQDGKKPFLEVDLHIHHLVADERHMTNHQMLGVQMKHVERILIAAKASKYQRLVLIHGVGNGTLRNEIRTFIASQKNCECHEARFEDYGYGATEVGLWYN